MHTNMSRPPINLTDLPCSRSSLLTTVDASAIYDLYRRCDDYFLLQDGQHASASDAEILFTDVPSNMSIDDQFVVGCWEQSSLYALAAILIGYPKPDDWYLGFLLLDPSMRSRGFGQTIYSVIEQWASEHGAHRLLVAVLMENEPALRFWGRLGFDELRMTGPTMYKTKSHLVKEFSRSLA